MRHGKPIRRRRLCADIVRVWKANRQVYRVRKVWRQLKRESIGAARCVVRAGTVDTAGRLAGRDTRQAGTHDDGPTTMH
jgi:hypothetical protein